MKMRSNSYARFTNPGKFMTPKTWAEEAVQDGDRLRRMLEGRRILVLGPFVPSTHEVKEEVDAL